MITVRAEEPACMATPVGQMKIPAAITEIYRTSVLLMRMSKLHLTVARDRAQSADGNVIKCPLYNCDQSVHKGVFKGGGGVMGVMGVSNFRVEG